MGEHGNGGEHGGHDGEHGHGFHGNPVLNGMSAVDVLHLMGEGALSGGAGAGSFGHLAEHMGEEALEVWKGAGTTGQSIGAGATAIASPIAIAGGAMEIIDAVNMIRHGDTAGGITTGVAGGATAASGVAGLMGLGGSAAGAAAAPILSAGAAGVKGGMYANHDVKERGWLHDREGNDASISEWAAENGQAVDEWVSDHSFGPLGTFAGALTTWGSSLAGTGIALADLGLNAGEVLLGNVGIGDMLTAASGDGGGDSMAAFRSGVARGTGSPDPQSSIGAFHQGIANSKR